MSRRKELARNKGCQLIDVGGLVSVSSMTQIDTRR